MVLADISRYGDAVLAWAGVSATTPYHFQNIFSKFLGFVAERLPLASICSKLIFCSCAFLWAISLSRATIAGSGFAGAGAGFVGSTAAFAFATRSAFFFSSSATTFFSSSYFDCRALLPASVFQPAFPRLSFGLSFGLLSGP